MITRFPGLTATRSRAVVHGGLVFTVAVSPDPAPPGSTNRRNGRSSASTRA